MSDTKRIPQHYDYIIVGAGSTGSVIANRLSKDPSVSVCLVEAGGSDANPRVQVPAGTITLYKSNRFSWNFFSTPQKALNNRSLHCPRGKALGGSASMNSMIYIRGDASDYDYWEESGCSGWGWKDVLPYFKRSERNLLGQSAEYHGFDGELLVDKARDPNKFSTLFVKAAQAIGLPLNNDFNGGSLEGCGIYNLTQKNATRLSSYRAFVHPLLEARNNLTLLTACEVDQLIIEGTTVKGIRLIRQGQPETIYADREVILSAGSIGSPTILLQSGVGPAEELKAAGIETVLDLKGVGKNLQDHLDGLVTVRSDNPATLGFSISALPAIIASPFKYLLQKSGWLTTNYVEAGGFAKTPLSNELADVQFHFVPGYRSHRGRLFEWGHGYAIHTCVLRPESIGELRLNRNKEIELDYNFLADMKDAQVLIEGIRMARKILAQDHFSPYRGVEMLPGKEVQTDAQLLEYIREYAATVFHPVGTCKMGIDEAAVVAPDLKVRGLQNLRIADASIMPRLISGNTNAPCIMIGEKAADLILNSSI